MWEIMHEGHVILGDQFYYYRILKEPSNKLGFNFYEVDIPGLLEEPNPYGYFNDTERHLGFQIAVVDWLNAHQDLPDVIHCHDHHAGLIPFMMYSCFQYQRLQALPTVFTIHNGNYQGWISWDKSYLIPPFNSAYYGMLEWNKAINSMACAIKCCSRLTTVSPTYLEELRYYSQGLEPLFNSERQKSRGILNGIDTDVWNPGTDTWIDGTYTSKNVTGGKRKNKEALCKSFGLDAGKPLFAFIGRLVPEKGADFLAESIYRSVNDQGGKLNFLVLGSGTNEYEHALNALKNSLPQDFNCYIGYDEKLSHLIYAGSDFLLMPSRTEPCGLGQLYALRYGTIPIVRSVGGLKDTVADLGDEAGFGIRFDQASVNDIRYSVGRAMGIVHDKEKLTSIRKKIMSIDHSWDRVATEYMNLYQSLK